MTDRDLLSRIGWDLSPFDARAHAVDPLDQDLTGVYVALCDAKMLAGQLHPLPNDGLCVDCAQRIVASRVVKPPLGHAPRRRTLPCPGATVP